MNSTTILALLAVVITAVHAQSQTPEVVRTSSSRSEEDCPKYCLDIYDPVGDEEGNTYSNECYMKRAKCARNELTIPPKWKNLRVINEDSSSAKCGGGCPDVEEPVCGSNGVRYGNSCELEYAACKHPELNIVADSGKACVGSKMKTIGDESS